ncbi:GNAT family N-acetyltransferase [Actinoplanes sp. NPDC049548]|uniref:GNAT family N-acetyltransferase n=1 Tax=Actinoplanes sp. NPDC049548 TaxID=3155152 RepID=UPI0034172DB7
MTSEDVRIARDDSAAAQRAAAGIWARATARRDNLPEAAPVEEKLPGIQGRLSTPDGVLYLALLHGAAAGFALTVVHPSVLEVVYLAVNPDAWGAGIGRKLLAHVDTEAGARGISHLELWVIDDNERAVGVYAESGWRRTDRVRDQKPTGRRERLLVRDFEDRVVLLRPGLD